MSESTAGAPSPVSIRGTVARVLFENRESGWTVFHLRAEDGEQITVVGTLAPVMPGEELTIQGAWETDRRYGRQFRGLTTQAVLPDSVVGIRRYLGSGVVPGIGPELARRLVQEFGTDTLRVLDQEPRRLLQVRGIGPKRLQQIESAWVQRSAERQARIFLQGQGLGPGLAERILRAWGPDTVARVKDDPYALIIDVPGVGFRTADVLAVRLGLEETSAPRIRAGVRHTLRLAAQAGDCYVPMPDLVERTRTLLQVQETQIVHEAVRALEAERAIVIEPAAQHERVYPAWLHGAEQRTARRLVALVHDDTGLLSPELADRTLSEVESRLHLQLSTAQRRAVVQALSHRLLVVTGGPGTGKTTLIDALARCLRLVGKRLALAAPTGRAAKRMEQATGRPARTLHRLLEYRYETGFQRGPAYPIEADLVVVDEVSMVDLPLMDALLAAIAPPTHLLLVGDADQLPPVGPGAVLRDVIDSDAVPVVALREIYRQDKASLIVQNAHRVNAGRVPVSAQRADGELGAGPRADFFILEEKDPERALQLVRRLVSERIPNRFGLDPLYDIQVLAPMHRGRAGVQAINALLQQTLNPAQGPSPGALRPRDRVMQLRNDYDREVFNGDIGHVLYVSEHGDEVTVEFDGRPVGYDRGARADLALAYAISVHKSQGSEYPAVVALLLPEHHIMLQRNLLYTALTRARKLAVLITTRAALERAVRNDKPAARYTGLAERLRGPEQSTRRTPR